MVGQVVAGAVAPVVVQSATSEDGLINKLFKIAILLVVLVIIAIVVGVFVFISDTDIGETVRGFFGGGATLIGGALPLGLGIPFRLLGLGITGLGSAFAFRRS